MAAFQALKTETDAFESGAKEYRDAVTTIIRLHYEAKKKEILSGLDDEISVEKGEAKKARETAIKRLEDFIATYSGPRAKDPESPDAMYRLAALYEDRARAEDATDDLSIGLKPAIALYKRIINEYPGYKQLAAVFYFLAHAYDDASRQDESQRVYRSLVCHNHSKYPTHSRTRRDPSTAIPILPVPQDHDQEYWSTWRNLNRDPGSLKRGADTTYVDPYPADCVAMPQPDLQPGEPSKVGESWWNIGNWEFDQLDLGGGVVKDEPGAVYDYDRAASAYQHAMQFHVYPIYRRGALQVRQDALAARFQEATKQFVQLLLYTDDLMKERGDPGVDFQTEAYQYIAGSLAIVDFQGPGPNEPYMQRADIFDTVARSDEGRDQAARGDRSRPRSCAHPAGQEVDDQHLPRARRRIQIAPGSSNSAIKISAGRC